MKIAYLKLKKWGIELAAGELVLEDITNKIDCRGVALVARDGSTLTHRFDDGVSVDTFSIMSATLMGAAMTAGKEVGRKDVNSVAIKSVDGPILVYPAGKRNLLVLVLDSVPDNIDDILREPLNDLTKL